MNAQWIKLYLAAAALAFGSGLSALAQTADGMMPPENRLSLRYVPNEPAQLLAAVPSGQHFALQASENLLCWHRVSSLIGSDADLQVADSSAAASDRRFYRLVRDASLFRFNARHSGVADAEGVTRTNVSLKWKFQTGDEVFSSPALAGGTLFIGSVDTNFYALDAESGTEKWHFRAAGAIRSSAAVLDGVAYFSSRDGFLYALRAEDGNELWRARIAEPSQTGSVDDWDYFDSSPTIVDQVLYVGSGDKKVYAINARTGETLWTFLTRAKVRSTPAWVNGVVYVGGLDGYLYSLDAASGTNLWKFKAQGNGSFPNGEIYHAPAVIDGTVYFGSRDSALYALDAATGKRKWRHDVCGGVTWVYNSPAVANGLAMLGTSIPGYLIALETATGKQKWQFAAPNLVQVYSSPAIVSGVAYFGCGDAVTPRTSPAHPKPKAASVHAVDIATGKERWKFPTGGQVFSSPVVADGSVYFGCLDGAVYALH